MTQDQKNQKLAEHFQMCPLFDYFTSLDAVHELEMKLDHIQHALFREKLCRVCCDDQGFNWRNTYSATAAQRAKALGLTLGLWEEGE